MHRTNLLKKLPGFLEKGREEEVLQEFAFYVIFLFFRFLAKACFFINVVSHGILGVKKEIWKWSIWLPLSSALVLVYPFRDISGNC